MSNGNGHRWSKFWWQDWQNDQALKLCSLAAQGLWMRMLCIMHDNSGYLLLGGEAPDDGQLARLVGAHWREVRTLLAELLRHQVCRKNSAGIIYSRRMIKDLEASEIGAQHAEKRWKQPKSDVPPSPKPNGSPNGQPNAQAYRDPNARSLEAEAEEERTPVSPHGVGTAPAEPGTPARRADASNPRALGTNPRAIGTNPRARKRGFAEYERRFEAAHAAGPVIDATAEEVADFQAFRRRLTGGANG